jgi:hypothetical protein
MRRDGVEELLSTANASWEILEKLIRENKIKEVEYQGKKYYLRRFRETHV